MQKIIGVPSKKLLTTSRQPRKLIFGVQHYLTQLDEICKNNNDWGAINKTKIGVPSKKIIKINLIGCDTIVNSPSFFCCLKLFVKL